MSHVPFLLHKELNTWFCVSKFCCKVLMLLTWDKTGHSGAHASEHLSTANSSDPQPRCGRERPAPSSNPLRLSVSLEESRILLPTGGSWALKAKEKAIKTIFSQESTQYRNQRRNKTHITLDSGRALQLKLQAHEHVRFCGTHPPLQCQNTGNYFQGDLR